MADAFSTTGSLILDPLVSLWNSFVTILPGVIAAIILLIIGYFIGLGIGHLVKLVVEKSGLDHYLQKSKFAKSAGHFRISGVVGEITKWYIFLIFLSAGVDLLELGALSSLLQEFVRWIPSLILAGVVVILGVAFAHWLSMKIEEHTETRGVRFFSKILKIVVYFVVLIVALQQIGVDVSILENTWYLLVGALAVGLAIALGVGLGGSLKQEGREIVDELKGLMKH